MENIDSIKAAIDSNANFSIEFKENLKTLLESLVTTLPNYDYSNFNSVLSSLKITSENIEGYTKYEPETNTLKLNIELINEDRLDYQHLLLNEILLICNKSYQSNETYTGLNNGISEMISLLVNSDESMKKLNIVPYLNARVLSKVVGGEVLISSFMTQDYTELFVELEKKGLSTEDSTKLIRNMNDEKMLPDNEFIMSRIMRNNSSQEEFNEFKEYLVLDQKELLIYPLYNPTTMNSFMPLNSEITKPVVNIEQKEKVA